MKTYTNFAAALLMLLILGCGHNVQKSEGQSFVPPTVKVQPRFFYPATAQENSYSGISKIIITISNTGTVEKASIIKSSGYAILDNAALDYCKSIVFNPAVRDGKAVISRVEWDVKFNLAGQKIDPGDYLKKIKDLYKEAALLNGSQKDAVAGEILKCHNNYVQNMRDALNFNVVLKDVLTPALFENWKDYWHIGPLSFLVYYDFIQRFPQYNDSAGINSMIHNALKADINYIKSSNPANREMRKDKEDLLNKIREFVREKYPDFLLEEVSIRKTGIDLYF